MSGRLVILSGPSGVGKDTVIDAWHAVNPRVQRVVATTTRSPRPGEVDGTDYHFVTLAEFESMAARGEFLERKQVHGNFYATPISGVDRLLNEGKIAILKIDVQGALEVMALRPGILSVFLLPPSIEELEARIRGRNSDSAEAVAQRLQEARNELAVAEKYTHRVVNDEVESAVARLQEIVCL